MLSPCHQLEKIVGSSFSWQVKYSFGSLGLLTASLLFRHSTRSLGLIMAIAVTLVGRIYPHMTVKSLGGENLVMPTAALLVAAFSLGLLS